MSQTMQSLLLLATASLSLAAPLAPRHEGHDNGPTSITLTTTAKLSSTDNAWNAGAVKDYTIHASCNATQRAYLQSGLEETMTLCRHARDHILRFGSSSKIYQKYFGDAPTGEPLGWFTKIVDGDKDGIVFRCDNIDGNCRLPGWAGHWRGSNATSETVICDLSYEARRPLEGMCMFGYNVANGATNFYWASDLLHRLLHIPQVGEGVVEHYSESPKYPGVIELAKTNSTFAAKNSDTLQFFALEAYAHDIAVPGVGCPGVYTGPGVKSKTATAAPAPTSTKAAEPTGGAGACTPHGDHWHCPPGVKEPANPPPASK